MRVSNRAMKWLWSIERIKLVAFSRYLFKSTLFSHSSNDYLFIYMRRIHFAIVYLAGFIV